MKRTSGISGGLMHNKYVIFDGKVLITGSYNWSANAEERSFENVVVVRDSPVIQDYIADFERIWDRVSGLLRFPPWAEPREERAA